jgi:hypothetical protein
VGLIHALQWVLGVLCALTAIVVVVQMVRARFASNLVDALFAVIEAGLVLQLVIGIIVTTHAPSGVSLVTYIGYLLGSLVILPAAWVWSQAERSRGGLGVLLVGLAVVPFLFLRLSQVWSARG